MSNEKNTMGNWVDELSIVELINREDFIKLEVFRRFSTINGELVVSDNDYWEITFESKTKDEQGLFTFHQSKSPQPFFKVYKIKSHDKQR